MLCNVVLTQGQDADLRPAWKASAGRHHCGPASVTFAASIQTACHQFCQHSATLTAQVETTLELTQERPTDSAHVPGLGMLSLT